MGDKFTESIIVSSIQRVNPERTIALRLCNSSRSRRNYLVGDAAGLLIYFPLEGIHPGSPPTETVITQISLGEGCEWSLMVELNRTQALNIRLILQPHKPKFSGTCNKSYLLLLLGDGNIYISHSLSISRTPIRKDTDTMAPLINLSCMDGSSQGSIPIPVMQGLRNRLEAARQLHIREKAINLALKQSLGMKLPSQPLSSFIDAAQTPNAMVEETEENPNLLEIAYKPNEPLQIQVPPMVGNYLPDYEDRRICGLKNATNPKYYHEKETNVPGPRTNSDSKISLLVEIALEDADESSSTEYNSMNLHKRARKTELRKNVEPNPRSNSTSYPVSNYSHSSSEIGMYSTLALSSKSKFDASTLKIFFTGPILCNHNWRKSSGYPLQQVTIGSSSKCDFILPFPGIPDVLVAIIPPNREFPFFRIQNIDGKRFINTNGIVMEDGSSNCELSPEGMYTLSHMASFYVEIVANPETNRLIVMPHFFPNPRVFS